MRKKEKYLFPNSLEWQFDFLNYLVHFLVPSDRTNLNSWCSWWFEKSHRHTFHSSCKYMLTTLLFLLIWHIRWLVFTLHSNYHCLNNNPNSQINPFIFIFIDPHHFSLECISLSLLGYLDVSTLDYTLWWLDSRRSCYYRRVDLFLLFIFRCGCFWLKGYLSWWRYYSWYGSWRSNSFFLVF